MDIDGPKLAIIGKLCQILAERAGSRVRITTTTDPRAAIEGASYVVTSIRVGGDAGRVLDERIALRYGVLGQETTGPGGFAMALRSIPAILGYARLIDEAAPGAWMFNFTNPAGLVAQALHDAGFPRAVGICDGANQAQHAVAHWLEVPLADVQTEVYGLNHLSWTRRAWVNGRDVLPGLLADDGFLSRTEQRVFEPELVRHFGEWLNEYLYYYYYAERAVAAIQGEEKTRGEEIVEINRHLLAALGKIDLEREPDRALRTYYAANERRGATYMHYARPDAPDMDEADQHDFAPCADRSGAMRVKAMPGWRWTSSRRLRRTRPAGSRSTCPTAARSPAMRADDVVEISCTVDGQGIHPVPIGEVGANQELLMRSVKQYERLTVEAVRTRRRDTAALALMAHPLVLSYSRATALVDDYLRAHAPYVGDWR